MRYLSEGLEWGRGVPSGNGRDGRYGRDGRGILQFTIYNAQFLTPNFPRGARAHPLLCLGKHPRGMDAPTFVPLGAWRDAMRYLSEGHGRTRVCASASMARRHALPFPRGWSGGGGCPRETSEGIGRTHSCASARISTHPFVSFVPLCEKKAERIF